MSRPSFFILRAEHLALLAASYIRWEDCEYGAAAVDCKRPYGNSGGIEEDMAKLLGWPLFTDADGDEHLTREQDDAIRALHRETETALQILVLAKGEAVKLGRYELGTGIQQYNRRSWRWVSP